MTASSILSALLLSRQPSSLPWTLTFTSPPRAPPPRRPLFHLQTGLPCRQADGRRRRPPGPRRRAPRVRAGTSRKTLIETKEIERVGIAHPLSRPPSRRRRSFFLQIEFEPSLLSSLCSAPRALFSALCNQGMCVDALRAATIEVRAMSAFSNGKAARMIPARGRKKKKKAERRRPPFSSTSSTLSFSLSSFSLLSLSLLSLPLSSNSNVFFFRSTTASAERARARSSASPEPRAGPSSSSQPSSGPSTGHRRRTLATAPPAAARAMTRACRSECASLVRRELLIEKTRRDFEGEVVGLAQCIGCPCDFRFRFRVRAERGMAREQEHEKKPRRRARTRVFSLFCLGTVEFCNA